MRARLLFARLTKRAGPAASSATIRPLIVALPTGGAAAPAQFGQRFLGMRQPQLRRFAQRRRKIAQPVGVRQVGDRLALRGRRAGRPDHVGRFGVDQAVDAVLGFLERPDVLEVQDGAVRADRREHDHDRVESLEVDHRPAFAHIERGSMPSARTSAAMRSAAAGFGGDELQMVAGLRCGQRAAGQERGAQLHAPVAARARPRRQRGQPASESISNIVLRYSRGSIVRRTLPFAFAAQRAHQPRDRRAPRAHHAPAVQRRAPAKYASPSRSAARQCAAAGTSRASASFVSAERLERVRANRARRPCARRRSRTSRPACSDGSTRSGTIATRTVRNFVR